MPEASHPEWLPEPAPSPEPQPKTHVLQRAQPSERDQEWADFGDWLSAIYGWIRDQERWAAVEDHIDQAITNQSRIDQARERREGRGKR